MSNCTNVPIELIIATIDPSIGKLEWAGTLYYGITCNDELPSFVQPFDRTPITWDFCKSACDSTSEIFNLWFTFNKSSTVRSDYSKYTFTRDSVVNQGSTSIKDSAGKNIDFRISEMHIINGNTVELWLSKSTSGSPIITITNDSILSINNPLWAVLITISILIVIGVILYFIS